MNKDFETYPKKSQTSKMLSPGAPKYCKQQVPSAANAANAPQES